MMKNNNKKPVALHAKINVVSETILMSEWKVNSTYNSSGLVCTVQHKSSSSCPEFTLQKSQS